MRDLLVKPLVVKRYEHLIYDLDVLGCDHGIFFHTTEQGYLVLEALRQGSLGAAKQYVRLNTYPAQFVHAVLGRLGLHFICGLDKGHESQMNEEGIFLPEVVTKLPYCFEKRKPLDVADGPAYFNNDNINAFIDIEDPALYLIRNVGYDLNGPAEVLSFSLARNDRVIDLTGGEITFLGKSLRL